MGQIMKSTFSNPTMQFQPTSDGGLSCNTVVEAFIVEIIFQSEAKIRQIRQPLFGGKCFMTNIK